MQALDPEPTIKEIELKKPTGDFRKDIMTFEQALASVPGAKIGHEMDEDLCPLKHTFVDGAYVREIFMPKGLLITSKIHKVLHPYFVMKGKCAVVTEDSIEKIEAPHYGVTPPGTKRAIYIYEDTVWITVHVTDETDLDRIEEQIIAKDFSEVGPAIAHEQILKLKEW